MIEWFYFLQAETVKLIAEVGINHNGDIELAKQLCTLAQSAGWNYVKFQKRTVDIVYSADYLDSPRDSPWGSTQRDQKLGLEFTADDFDEIDSHCKQIGIQWFASAWDKQSLEFLEKYNLPCHKIASAMLTNLDFVEDVAKLRNYTYISTGMSTLSDIEAAVEIFKRHSCEFELMHTCSTYPSSEDELNLSLIPFMREKFGVNVGYSGHESGLTPSFIAAVLGASSIERHVTLDRAMYGSDQAASLAPEGVFKLARMIKSIPVCLGSPVKSVSDRELEVASKLRYWDAI